MDGTTLQAKIDGGYAKAATRIGFACTVYRTASLSTPIAAGNIALTAFPVSFTTGMNYSQYNKPDVPFWTCLADHSLLQIGDWIVGAEGAFFIADKQSTLPVPAIECNRTISILRVSSAYDLTNGLRVVETQIAVALPVFMRVSKDKTKKPEATASTTATDNKVSIPEWDFFINARTVGSIQKHDIIVDENGTRYEIDTPQFTSFGFVAIAHEMKP